MEYINDFIRWFKRNSRLFFAWFFLIIVFLVFENRISSILSEFSVIGFKETNGKYFQLVFSVFKIFLYSLFGWFFIKNYRLSKITNFWILFISFSYIILKTNHTDNLIFIQNKAPDKYFADIIIIMGFLVLVLYLRNCFGDFKFYEKFKTDIEHWLYIKDFQLSSEYQEDLPIDGSIEIENDKIIDALIPQIINLTPHKAFVIGLNSDWGSGKTTFLNRLCYQLKYNSVNHEQLPIIFWFNAWQHQDEKSIINNFFNQLKKELSKYSGDAKSSVNKYLNRLFALIDNTYTKGLHLFINEIFSNDITITDYYDNINDLISRIDKKIIVFVDDLDRLNKDEILEVVRILRNVADFKNTIFICGFDKNYVMKTAGFDDRFLDKIFNLEINIPKLHENGILLFFNELINSSNLIKEKELIIDSFKSIFNTSDDSDITIDDIIDNEVEMVDSLEADNEPNIEFISLKPSLIFENRRDVKRFYNSLITNIIILDSIEDVDLKDYLLFKLLIFKYSWLLKYFDSKRLNIWFGEDSILQFNSNNPSYKGLTNNVEYVDRAIIYTILINLFPKSDGYTDESSIAINQRRYFPIYLNNNVLNQSFSYSELLKAHKNIKIETLIKDKILGDENEHYLLSDVKNFIIQKENLNTIDEFRQASKIIKKHLGDSLSDLQLLRFIHFANDLKGAKEFLTYEMFVNINDAFGYFLLNLNRFYSALPSDYSLNKDEISSFFYAEKIKELKFVNKSFTRAKLVELYAKFINESSNFRQALIILVSCTEKYYSFYDLRLYYPEIIEIVKKFIEKNYKKYFLELEPSEISTLMKPDYFASIFLTDKERSEIIRKADQLLNDNSSWSSSDLNKMSFVDNGWWGFVKFIGNLKSKLNLTDSEMVKIDEQIIYLIAFINNRFSAPSTEKLIIARSNYHSKESKKNDSKEG